MAIDLIQKLQTYKINRSWVAIGSFDGVHLGHQAIFDRLVNGSRKAGCSSVVITFNPHPAVFFNRVESGYALTSLDEREKLIQSTGVDHVITLKFDRALADLDAYYFMKVLRSMIGIERLLAGFNFNLGRGQSGDTAKLSEIGRTLGYEVETLEAVKVKDEVISSSRVREYLRGGEVTKANLFLGRVYNITGKVIHGEHRGEKIGIPTANLDISPDRLIPGIGVYATRALVEGERYGAVTNIGIRPTFENPLTSPRIEPHLLDTDKSLYDETITLEFIEFLRPEIKFPDVKALVDQIRLDILKTREILASEA